MRRASGVSLKAQRSAATREDIVSASLALFAHQGIHGTSIEEIAGRAGLTKGAIYWHFESKKALFGAILDKIKHAWQRTVLQRVAEAPDPLQKVDLLFENYFELLSHQPEICLFLQRVMLEAEEKYTSKVNDVFAQTAKVIAGIFEQGKEAGLFRKELDSRLLAYSILSSLAGAVAHCQSDVSLAFGELIEEIKRGVLARAGPGG
jgi:AcrR family transcriptional regulator